jgi:hypothetical protein
MSRDGSVQGTVLTAGPVSARIHLSGQIIGSVLMAELLDATALQPGRTFEGRVLDVDLEQGFALLGAAGAPDYRLSSAQREAADQITIEASKRSSTGSAPTVLTADRVRILRSVLAAAFSLWSPRIAVIWMMSRNAHLSGASPIDVLAIDGPREVIEALDAVASGSYA